MKFGFCRKINSSQAFMPIKLCLKNDGYIILCAFDGRIICKSKVIAGVYRKHPSSGLRKKKTISMTCLTILHQKRF